MDPQGAVPQARPLGGRQGGGRSRFQSSVGIAGLLYKPRRPWPRVAGFACVTRHLCRSRATSAFRGRGVTIGGAKNLLKENAKMKSRVLTSVALAAAAAVMFSTAAGSTAR